MYSISSSRIGQEDPAQLSSFAQTMGLTMPVLLDDTSDTYYDYYIESPDAFSPYPREFVIGKDGRIVFAASNIDIPAIQTAVESALTGTP